MAPRSTLSPSTAEAQILGQALRNLREAGNLTQAQAAEALGVSTQAWQRYEAGDRNAMLRVDLQQRATHALGRTVQDLMDERKRVLGEPGARAPPPARQAPPTIPVWGRARAGSRAPLTYDLREPDSYFDLDWLTADKSGALRVAGDSMTGYVESGQLVIYDRTRWPRRGEGCVVETTEGEVYVKEYVELDGETLKVKQRFPAGEMTFPMADIRGVYAIRFRGD